MKIKKPGLPLIACLLAVIMVLTSVPLRADFFYVLNLIMVGVDLCLYIRNYRLDKEAENERAA